MVEMRFIDGLLRTDEKGLRSILAWKKNVDWIEIEFSKKMYED